MNERIYELAEQCTTSCVDGRGVELIEIDVEKFAELIYKDIITVVAAQALLNESALDVFKNLKRIYEGEQQ